MLYKPLFKRLMKAKCNGIKSIVLDKEDISLLIDLIYDVEHHLDAIAEYDTCDIQRKCIEQEKNNISSSEHYCIKEILKVRDTGRKLMHTYNEMGFYGKGRKRNV